MLNIQHKPNQAVIDAFKKYRAELADQIVLKFPLSPETQAQMTELEKIDQQLDWLETDKKGNVQGGPDFEPELLQRLGIIEDVKLRKDVIDPVHVNKTMEDWKKINHEAEDDLLERKKAAESVKKLWQKIHNPSKTPWRTQLDASKREYQIEKRAEELFRTSGLYTAVMKAFKDYARLELMYTELRNITTPPVDIDEEEAELNGDGHYDNIDVLEAERLGIPLTKNIKSKTTNGPKPDPAI